MLIQQIAQAAHKASAVMKNLTTQQKNALLLTLKTLLLDNKELILEQNAKDVLKAKQANLASAMVDRLTLNDKNFAELVDGVGKVILLEDPVGEILQGYKVESNLNIVKKRVPFGVIAVIYESRPNVTIDIATLCIKSGNCFILKGGKEAILTNKALFDCIKQALAKHNLDTNIASLLEDSDRDNLKELLKLDQYIDLIIPRGGQKLQRFCLENATVPVITGGFGISHIFVDESASLDKAIEIILNAKLQKPSACNALDTLILHQNIADKFIEKLKQHLQNHQVYVHACDKCYDLFKDYEYLVRLQEQDLDTEWLSLNMSCVVVEDVKAAVELMCEHNACHSDAILTNNITNANYFVNHASSACVYVNASTRFSDGGQFGFGCEVAISTQKLHVRGPMGLKELTTYQYVLNGDYLVRS